MYLDTHNQSLGLIEQLQRENDQLKLMVQTVSHDLRNPVIGLSMMLQSMLSVERSEYIFHRQELEQILNSCQRQQNLIDSLVQVPHQNLPVVSTSPSPLEGVSLSEIIDDLLQDWQPRLAQHQVQLKTNIEANLPKIAIKTTPLWRVLENLVANALKYNHAGFELTIEAVQEVEDVRCVVADNGTGLEASRYNDLFAAYTQGTTMGNGMGLGLFICRCIIEAYGGQIGVNSDLGVGSCFWFTVPIVKHQ